MNEHVAPDGSHIAYAAESARTERNGALAPLQTKAYVEVGCRAVLT